MKRNELNMIKGAFWRNESGSATIETVLWIPVFVFFMAIVADMSFVFFGQNQAYRIVQDANRNLSIGRLNTEAEVETFITSALETMAPNAVVNTVIENGTVTSVVLLPASDLVATGISTVITDANLTITSRHLVEF